MIPAPATVTVVGAGILGAAAAVELQTVGHRVLILDDPEGAPAVSDLAFGWLNRAGSAAAGPGRQLPELARAFADTRTLLTRLPRPPHVSWTGALSWGETEADTRAFLDSVGDAARALSGGELRARIPGAVRTPALAAWAPNEASLDAAAFRQALLGGAIARGAELRSGRVDRVRPDGAGGFLVTAGADEWATARVLLACGASIPGLANQLGARVEIAPSPAARFTFSAPDLRLETVLSTPDFEIRPDHGAPGRFVAAEDVTAGEPLAATLARAQESLAVVRASFGLAATPRPEHLSVGWRPIPVGRPIVCEALPGHPRVLTLAAHPGVTLAATLALRVTAWAAG